MYAARDVHVECCCFLLRFLPWALAEALITTTFNWCLAICLSLCLPAPITVTLGGRFKEFCYLGVCTPPSSTCCNVMVLLGVGCQEVDFDCDGAPSVTSAAQCFGPPWGNCPKGTRCFMKDSATTGEIYAACCCNMTTTPVLMVEQQHWSCFAKSVKPPGQQLAPFCQIKCCERHGCSFVCG